MEPASEPVSMDDVAARTPAPVGLSVVAQDQMAAFLARVALFADLPLVFLRRVAALGSEEVYARGSLIFKEGSPGDKLYLILEGRVRISREVQRVTQITPRVPVISTRSSAE